MDVDNPNNAEAWGGNPAAGSQQPQQTAAPTQPQPASTNAPPAPQQTALPTTELEVLSGMLNRIQVQDQRQHEFVDNLHKFGSALESLSNKIQNMTVNVNATPTQPTPRQAPSTPSVTASGTARFDPPPTFNGSIAEVLNFLQKISSAIFLSANSLPTDYHKTTYMHTFLGKGSPQAWYRSVLTHSPELLNDFEGFVESFKDHFDDPHVESTALRKIENLKQTGACAAYAARFEELLIHVDFSESTKIHKFKTGLKDSIKDALVAHRPKPTNFIEFVKLCLEIDGDLHDHDEERKSGNRNNSTNNSNARSNNANASRSNNSSYTPHSTNTSNTQQCSAPASDLPPGEPMEIDATSHRCGPLTSAEKDRRRREGLCLYCGQGKHLVKDCPNMSEKSKKQYAERRVTPASAGKA